MGLLGSVWASWAPFGPPGLHLGLLGSIAQNATKNPGTYCLEPGNLSPGCSWPCAQARLGRKLLQTLCLLAMLRDAFDYKKTSKVTERPSKGLLQTLCLLAMLREALHAPCMLHAECFMLHPPCSMLHALCSVTRQLGVQQGSAGCAARKPCRAR